MININEIRKLREETGAGVLEVKQALESEKGNYEKAKAVLMKKSAAKAAKKTGRKIKDGLVHAYIHSNEKVGSIVSVGCETDFVARTEDFKNLCHELALQIASGEYESVEELLKDEYMRDSSKTVKNVIDEVTAKVGEKIQILEFKRLTVK